MTELPMTMALGGCVQVLVALLWLLVGTLALKRSFGGGLCVIAAGLLKTLSPCVGFALAFGVNEGSITPIHLAWVPASIGLLVTALVLAGIAVLAMAVRQEATL